MNQLKLRRLELGLSQHELAAEAGVPRYRIQLCEQAIALPKQEEQERLALALGVSVEKIFPCLSNAPLERGQKK